MGGGRLPNFQAAERRQVDAAREAASDHVRWPLRAVASADVLRLVRDRAPDCRRGRGDPSVAASLCSLRLPEGRDKIREERSKHAADPPTAWAPVDHKIFYRKDLGWPRPSNPEPEGDVVRGVPKRSDIVLSWDTTRDDTVERAGSHTRGNTTLTQFRQCHTLIGLYLNG